MKQKIRISPRELGQVKAFLKDGKKINAIKHARMHGKEFPGKEIEKPDEDGNLVTEINHRVGLRNAKDAVEALDGSNVNPVCTFANAVRIKKVIVEGELGDIELDIDELQLKLLDGLGTLPLQEVAAMTELVTFIRKWQGDDEE
jgi:hypothetical protein